MSDRHEKWVRVEPGTVIPAGQPYRMEYAEDGVQEVTATATEYVATEDRHLGSGSVKWFIDSSWRPPLELPTEPTWGIVKNGPYGHFLGRWYLNVKDERPMLRDSEGRWSAKTPGEVHDFIPCTPEQVARIEGAR